MMTQQTGTQAISHDLFDAETYRESRENYPRLDETLTTRGAELATADALFQDTFLSFYQRRPELRDAGELDAAYRPNRGIMAELLGTQDHARLRGAGTVGDELSSAIATASVLDRVLGALPADAREKINQHAQAAQDAEKLFSQADTLDDLADERQLPELHDRADAARQRAEAAQALADQLAGELQAGEEALGDAVRGAARGAMADAQAEIEQLAAAMTAFGAGQDAGTGEGGGSVTDKLAVARRLRQNPKLGQLAQMVGRYMQIALAVQRSKVDNQPSEVSGVRFGNDVAHLLPSEIALLANDDTEDVFFLKFAEAKLMQYEIFSRDKTGRGPLIVATDESSSMTTPLGDATRELWSKAVALALLAVARKQGRDFAWLHFGSQGEYRQDEFPAGKATPAQALAAADHFFGGGTDYAAWMQGALQLVETSAYDKADVVLLSDGVADTAQLQARWNAARKSRDMRAYAVLIADSTLSAQALATIADSVFSVADLAGEGAALKTIFAV